MNQNNNKTLKNELEDLQYELSIVLEAMLLYAGVKREKLENAIEAYISISGFKPSSKSFMPYS